MAQFTFKNDHFVANVANDLEGDERQIRESSQKVVMLTCEQDGGSFLSKAMALRMKGKDLGFAICSAWKGF